MWAAVSNSDSVMTLLSWFGQTARCGWLAPKKKIASTAWKEFSPPQFYCFNCCTVYDKENTVDVYQFIPIPLGDNASFQWFQTLKMCDSTLLLNIVLFKYCIFFPSGFQQLADASAQMQALQLQNSELFRCTELFCLWNFLHIYRACKKVCETSEPLSFFFSICSLFTCPSLVLSASYWQTRFFMGCVFVFFLASSNWWKSLVWMQLWS